MVTVMVMVMSPHHSDQMSQRSLVSRVALWRCSQNVIVFVIVIVFVFVLVIVFLLVRSCPFITLIKCLKGHKSLGSLCSVVKTLIVSGVRRTNQPSKGQGHLLSCSGQLKTKASCFRIFIVLALQNWDSSDKWLNSLRRSLFHWQNFLFFAILFHRQV